MQDRPRMRSRLHSIAGVKTETETVTVPDAIGSEQHHPTQALRRYGWCHGEKPRGVEADVVDI